MTSPKAACTRAEYFADSVTVTACDVHARETREGNLDTEARQPRRGMPREAGASLFLRWAGRKDHVKNRQPLTHFCRSQVPALSPQPHTSVWFPCGHLGVTDSTFPSLLFLTYFRTFFTPQLSSLAFLLKCCSLYHKVLKAGGGDSGSQLT